MFFLYRLVFNLIYARSTNCAIQKVSERNSVCVYYFCTCIRTRATIHIMSEEILKRHAHVVSTKVDGKQAQSVELFAHSATEALYALH